MEFQGSLGVDGSWYTVACLAGAAEELDAKPARGALPKSQAGLGSGLGGEDDAVNQLPWWWTTPT